MSKAGCPLVEEVAAYTRHMQSGRTLSVLVLGGSGKLAVLLDDCTYRMGLVEEVRQMVHVAVLPSSGLGEVEVGIETGLEERRVGEAVVSRCHLQMHAAAPAGSTGSALRPRRYALESAVKQSDEPVLGFQDMMSLGCQLGVERILMRVSLCITRSRPDAEVEGSVAHRRSGRSAGCGCVF